MRSFIERALAKLPKMDMEQIRSLIGDLAQQNDRLETVLDSMAHGVIVVDSRYRLVLCNKASERMLPFFRPDQGEEPVWALTRDRELSQFLRQTLERQETVQDRDFTFEAGSQLRTLSFSVTPLVRGGRIQGSLVHLEDVSEKRSKDARLRRAESLAALTTLAAGVAHEIKNPLGSIGIHIQLIQRALAGKDQIAPDSIKHFLDVINEEVERLNRIVVDFLFAVRPMDTRLVDDDLNRIIREMIDFLQYELEESRIAIRIDLENPLPLLRLDEKYLKQALLNIVKNAVAAMPDGGTITIRTAFRGDEVMLSITDTGIGIPEDIMGQDFRALFHDQRLRIRARIDGGIQGSQGAWSGDRGQFEGGGRERIFDPLPRPADRKTAPQLEGDRYVKFNVLIVDDEKNIREGLGKALELDGYQIFLASDGQEALNLIQNTEIDLVISDLKMPKVSGEDVLRQVASSYPTVPVMILTGHGTIEAAVKAMRNGAYDFLTKPVNLDRLSMLVRRALSSRENVLQLRRLQEELDKRRHFSNIIGKSAQIRKIFEVIQQVAPTRASVLITGESGVGKELIADAIHSLSGRREKPFIKVHCAALSESLLESELFGHEKGSFTGAVARKRGRFELANGGTIFLDEIGEINQNIQIKILRVLQEKQFERVGGEETLEVDVRVITATNRDLKEEIAAGGFREDLYYRLNVVNLHIPPLRERKDDIPLLVAAFLKEFSEENGKQIDGIDSKARAALYAYSWPGNIRELRNCIESSVVMSKGNIIGLDDLPPDVRNQTDENYIRIAVGATMADAEREVIRSTLSSLKGNKSRTAEILGIGRKTLHRKINEYRIEDPV